MRTALAVLVATALGFGAGWLVFDSPFAADGGAAASPEAIENSVAVYLRRRGVSADSVSCSQRQADTGYLCQVVIGLHDGNIATDAVTYYVRMDGMDVLSADARG